jgi:hypothetical protein
MKRPLTWLAIAAVVAVALAAVLDAVPSSDSSRHSAPLTSSEAETTTARAPPPPCRADQLALAIEYLDAPVAILRHVEGEPCRLSETPVSVRILARRGEGKGLLLGPEGSYSGFFASGVERVIAFRYSPRCDERGPFVAIVRAGDYAVRERIPVLRCGIGAQEVAATIPQPSRPPTGPVHRSRVHSSSSIASTPRSRELRVVALNLGDELLGGLPLDEELDRLAGLRGHDAVDDHGADRIAPARLRLDRRPS